MFDLGYPAHQYMSAKPGYLGTSLQQFHELFPDERTCLEHVFSVRYGPSPPCPVCKKAGKWYHIAATKRLQHPCGFALHPLGNTIFHKTRIPLQMWFYAMLHFANSAEGVDTPFLARHLGLSHDASFNLAKRIRLHIASLEYDRRIGGLDQPIQINIVELPNVYRPGARSVDAKLLLASDGDAVITKVIGPARRHIMRRALARSCRSGSKLFTTCFKTLRYSSDSGTRPSFLQNPIGKDDPAPNLVDLIGGFMSYVRRPLRDHHRRINHENLWRYIVEANFRFNRRDRSDQIFHEMVAQFKTMDSFETRKIELAFSDLAGITSGRSK